MKYYVCDNCGKPFREKFAKNPNRIFCPKCGANAVSELDYSEWIEYKTNMKGGIRCKNKRVKQLKITEFLTA